ncbi:hypothetical protein VPH35_111057 [Triticum aestivum]
MVRENRARFQPVREVPSCAKLVSKAPKLSPNCHLPNLDAKPAAAARCEMAGSKRTTAPTPLEFPCLPTQLVWPPTAQPLPLLAIPSIFGPHTWLPPHPPQSMAVSSLPCWLNGVQQP